MLLPDADAFSMTSSVELRVPFVDQAFFSLAQTSRAGSGQVGHKKLLTRALGDPYLMGLSRRRKRGFALPMKSWMQNGPLRSRVEAVGHDDEPVWDHVDPALGREVVARSATTGRWSEAWALAALNGWLGSVAGEPAAG
jgi:asparagine synthase (glutamine-hydrolysing)